jgi:hypothetical protein
VSNEHGFCVGEVVSGWKGRDCHDKIPTRLTTSGNDPNVEKVNEMVKNDQ